MKEKKLPCSSMHKCLLCGSIERVKVSVSRGDLTTEKVDAIVNASNESLLHEGGLAKTILDKGGKIIGQESNKIIKKRKSLKEGQAVLTKSGNQHDIVLKVTVVFQDMKVNVQPPLTTCQLNIISFVA